MATINGETTTGYAYSINNEVVQDWEFLNEMMKLDSGELTQSEQLMSSHRLLELLLGDGLPSFEAHVRSLHEGYFNFPHAMQLFQEIILANDNTKK